MFNFDLNLKIFATRFIYLFIYKKNKWVHNKNCPDQCLFCLVYQSTYLCTVVYYYTQQHVLNYLCLHRLGHAFWTGPAVSALQPFPTTNQNIVHESDQYINFGNPEQNSVLIGLLKWKDLLSSSTIKQWPTLLALALFSLPKLYLMMKNKTSNLAWNYMEMEGEPTQLLLKMELGPISKKLWRETRLEMEMIQPGSHLKTMT